MALDNPVNGQVLTVHGTTYGETAEYSCHKGYEVQGVSSRTCNENGVWTASPPTCVILGKLAIGSDTSCHML